MSTVRNINWNTRGDAERTAADYRKRGFTAHVRELRDGSGQLLDRYVDVRG